MATNSKRQTREALLDAAEELFASEGVASVSLASITQLAKQRHGGAIHYYFGGRNGLLEAILDRHQAVLDEMRMDALIELRRSGPVTIEALLHIVVESLASRLDSPSGRSFLAIQRNRLVELGGSWSFRSKTMQLVAAEAAAILDDRGFDEQERTERLRLVTQLVMHRIADRSREETAGTTMPRGQFIEILVSASASILSGGRTAAT